MISNRCDEDNMLQAYFFQSKISAFRAAEMILNMRSCWQCRDAQGPSANYKTTAIVETDNHKTVLDITAIHCSITKITTAFTCLQLIILQHLVLYPKRPFQNLNEFLWEMKFSNFTLMYYRPMNLCPTVQRVLLIIPQLSLWQFSWIFINNGVE